MPGAFLEQVGIGLPLRFARQGGENSVGSGGFEDRSLDISDAQLLGRSTGIVGVILLSTPSRNSGDDNFFVLCRQDLVEPGAQRTFVHDDVSIAGNIADGCGRHRRTAPAASLDWQQARADGMPL